MYHPVSLSSRKDRSEPDRGTPKAVWMPGGSFRSSGTTHAGLAAVTLGANMLELHITLGRDTGLPDEPASLLPDELTRLVEGVRFIETALRHPVDKERMAEELGELKRIFGKSIVAKRDLAKGHLLTEADIAFKKPGTGMPVSVRAEVIGKKLKKNVKANSVLTEEDMG